MSRALTLLYDMETRTNARLDELRGFERAGTREVVAIIVALVLGLVLVGLVNLSEADVDEGLQWILLAAPLGLQQLVSWSLRGWSRRRPPEWVVVEADGVQATVMRLVERLEHTRSQLDSSFRGSPLGVRRRSLRS